MLYEKEITIDRLCVSRDATLDAVRVLKKGGDRFDALCFMLDTLMFYSQLDKEYINHIMACMKKNTDTVWLIEKLTDVSITIDNQIIKTRIDNRKQ